MTSAKHQPILAPERPKPVGPYSPGMQLDRLLFISGQAARASATGVQAEGVEAQTEQVLRNLERILVAGGSSLQHVLRCGVFLSIGRMEGLLRGGVLERRGRGGPLTGAARAAHPVG
ncbi:RidA family protein [Corallococcus exercitus]|uniref:RidA family protein n=1 Tax=Corallococcus exercitus TaxID=2316736 RepID=UPI0020A3F120|nr:Rid family hydrolase [Corallococcus exercitus]